MKRLAIALLACIFSFPAMAMIYQIDMPPDEYRYEPKQKYIVTYVGPEYINNYCFISKKYLVYGCANAIGGDRIYIVNNLSKEDTEQVLIHEKAHLNGWTHPDRRAYFDEKASTENK